MVLLRKISFILIIIALHTNLSFARSMDFEEMDLDDFYDTEDLGENPNQKMKFARVVNSPYKELNNKIARIVGTSDEVWGWGPPGSFNNWAIYKYMQTTPPNDGGVVYYGKVDYIGYCFHESWLQEISKEEEKQFIERAKYFASQSAFREQ